MRNIRGVVLAAACGGVLQAQTITVSPATESVVVGGTHQFTATVTGLPSNTVTWSVNGMPGGGGTYGSINATGLYTAPSMVPANPAVTITATSTVNSAVSGSATATVKAPGPTLTSLSPNSVPVGAFSVTVYGNGFLPGATVWMSGKQLATTYVSATQLNATGGMNSAGSGIVYAANPGTMFSNYLTLTFTGSTPTSRVTIQPATAVVIQNGTQQFTALLNGAAQTAVWAVPTANGGTITATGLYTAPAAIPSPPTVTITATIGANAPASATVTVVSNQPPVVSSISVNPIPVGVFTLNIGGQGFINGSTATLGGAPLSTQYVSATQLTASGFASQAGASGIVVSNGPISSQPFAVQVGPLNPAITASQARRFLQQAAFGPSPADATHLQQVGLQAWVAEQFALPKASNYQNLGNQGGMPARFVSNAVGQPDQLRQRVAFALSELFSTSLNKLIWNSSMAPYQEMLMTDALSNFRQLLYDVTLSPGMGQMLDMANNAKANANNTVLPNENYAREILQLFSIGTVWLNGDGTKQLDANGNPIPTYSQSTISEFARVFTGWTYMPAPGKPLIWGAYINPAGPMVPYQPMHDTGAKTLLSYPLPATPVVYSTLAAGQTAQVDLNQALDNIFYHPNVGPFISKQLIQHLVKSNPTPAYVQRVANVFNSNSQGARGDMQAVITAILMDQEARQNDTPGTVPQPKDGHLQEPVLFLAGFLRALGATVNDQNYFPYELTQMGQDIYNAPSVFSYFSPGFMVAAGLGGPEFQIYNTYTSVYRANEVSNLFSSYSNSIQTYGPGTTVDLTPFVAMAGAPATLVDALDLTLTGALMPAGLKQILVNAVTAESGGNLRRVQTALYLLLSAGYYNVWN